MIRKWMDGDMEITVNDDDLAFISDIWLCRGRKGSGPIVVGQEFVIAKVRMGTSDEVIKRILRHKFKMDQVHRMTEEPFVTNTVLPAECDTDPGNPS